MKCIALTFLSVALAAQTPLPGRKGELARPNSQTIQELKAQVVSLKLEVDKLESDVKNKTSEISILQSESKILEARARAAHVKVDSQGYFFAISHDGMSFPVSIEKIETIPGVGIRYYIKVANIYAVALTDVSVSVVPVTKGAWMDFPNFNLQKLEKYPDPVPSSGSCIIPVTFLVDSSWVMPIALDINVEIDGLMYK